MKNSNVPFFGVTRTTSYNKSTHLTTTSETRPQFGLRQLVVFVDSNLHNDPIVNTHEFRAGIQSGYVGSYFREDNVEIRQVTGLSYFFNDTPVIPDPSSLRNSAIGDLYDKLRSGGVGSGLDLAVDIAEAHQVKKMGIDLYEVLRKVRTFNMSVRKLGIVLGPLSGKEIRSKSKRSPLTEDDFSIGPISGLLIPRKGVRLPSNYLTINPLKISADEVRKRVSTGWIARQWLAYSYGVMPLARSAYGTFDAVMHRRLYNTAVIKGKARDRSWSQKTRNDALFSGSSEILTTEWKSRYMVVGEFGIRNSAKQQLLGYTSLNPVNIAWELVPYSFVVDWIIDIGGYLRGLEGALAFGQQFVRGFEVGGYKTRIAGTAFSYRSLTAGVTQIVNAEGSNAYSYKRRIPLGVWPCPTLPQFDANLGWRRLVSAASLLRVLIKGK